MDKPKGDNCPKCGGPDRIFYESRRIPDRSGNGELSIGVFSCPYCGKEEIGYQVNGK